MTWIDTIPPEKADRQLRRCYDAVFTAIPPEYRDEIAALKNSDGTADSIPAAHSLIPEAMKHALATFGVLFSTRLPLTRRQQEMIATVVSAINRCFY